MSRAYETKVGKALSAFSGCNAPWKQGRQMENQLIVRKLCVKQGLWAHEIRLSFDIRKYVEVFCVLINDWFFFLSFAPKKSNICIFVAS